MNAEEFAKGKHEDKDSWMTKDSSGTYIFATSRSGGAYKGKLVCCRCGKVFKSDAKKKPYYCPACEEQGKELKSIRAHNEHYKKTGRWNMEPDKIGETARKAKEMGLSYGQYKALMQ